MRTNDLQGCRWILPIKYSLGGAPHATIETNRTCNIRCAHCYTIDKGHVKRLPDIKKEIDALAAKRNLQALTILGGEPTLHPDLAAIVKYIKKKNIRCQLLTNGIVFLSEEGDCLLNDLRAAGVDRITVHVDHGQSHIHGNIERVREILFDKLERRKMRFSLSITIDGPDQAVIPDLIEKYAHYCFFDGILSILARDPNTRDGIPGPILDDEYASISKQLEVEPCAYVPSNMDDRDVRWLIYYYFVNAETHFAFDLSSGVYFLYSWMYRLFARRSVFLVCISPFYVRFAFLFTAIIRVLLAPQRLLSFFRCIRSSKFMKAIRLHYIAVQVPPEFDEAAQTMRMCFSCPDATLRHGQLLPVCLADLMRPYGTGGEIAFMINPRYDSVRRHLEEAAH